MNMGSQDNKNNNVETFKEAFKYNWNVTRLISEYTQEITERRKRLVPFVPPTRIQQVFEDPEQYFFVKSLVVQIGSDTIDKKVRKHLVNILTAEKNVPKDGVRLTRKLREDTRVPERTHSILLDNGCYTDLVPKDLESLHYILLNMTVPRYANLLICHLAHKITTTAHPFIVSSQLFGSHGDYIITKVHNVKDLDQAEAELDAYKVAFTDPPDNKLRSDSLQHIDPYEFAFGM